MEARNGLSSKAKHKMSEKDKTYKEGNRAKNYLGRGEGALLILMRVKECEYLIGGSALLSKVGQFK